MTNCCCIEPDFIYDVWDDEAKEGSVPKESEVEQEMLTVRCEPAFGDLRVKDLQFGDVFTIKDHWSVFLKVIAGCVCIGVKDGKITVLRTSMMWITRDLNPQTEVEQLIGRIVIEGELE